MSRLVACGVLVLLLGLAGCETMAVYQASDVDRTPRMSKESRNLYEKALLDQGIVGNAIIRFVIRQDGTVRSAEAVSRSPRVIGALIPIATGFTFAPALKGGNPVDCVAFIQLGTGGPARPDPVAVWLERLRTYRLPGAYFDPKDVDSPAIPIHRVAPDYPFLERSTHTEGSAVVAFIVDPDGTVSRGWVLEASSPEFGQAALTAFKAWSFQPARKNGSPVPVLVVLPWVFAIAHPGEAR
jgi:TonB family protein